MVITLHKDTRKLATFETIHFDSSGEIHSVTSLVNKICLKLVGDVLCSFNKMVISLMLISFHFISFTPWVCNDRLDFRPLLLESDQRFSPRTGRRLRKEARVSFPNRMETQG